MGECLVAWGTSIDSIGSGSQIHGSFLEKFSASHGDTINDEHCFSSPDGWSIKKNHLEDMLWACVLDLKGSWEEHLSLMEFVYNNSYQASIQMTPYEALYGRPCRSPAC